MASLGRDSVSDCGVGVAHPPLVLGLRLNGRGLVVECRTSATGNGVAGHHATAALRQRTLEVLVFMSSLVLGGCNREDAVRARPERLSPAVNNTAEVHQPTRLQRLRIGSAMSGPAGGAHSGPIGTHASSSNLVGCDSCHSLGPVRRLPEAMQELTAFHQGLQLQHGELRCAACHAEGQSPRLHLADGRSLERANAIELCRQCHGPQFRDYQHGAHGGMAGYWDLKQGPRTRNHCVDCHDPHSPAVGQVWPADGPKDRFFGLAAQGEQTQAPLANVSPAVTAEGAGR
jgi:hypothetical protein